MKNLAIILFLLIGLTVQAQNILRVNNGAGINSPYTTLAAAVAAAGTNDIIMVEGSIVDYGSITINKKVTIVGPGYFLEENLNLQATPQTALIGAITLNTGASDSYFSGLVFTGQPGITVNSGNNISILNSQFTNCRGIHLNGTGTNMLINGNYKASGCQGFVECYGSYTGVLVSNNYFYTSILTGPTSSFTITNNIFGGVITSDIQNSFIQNNIFITPTNNPIAVSTGSTIKNNVFLQTQAGADGTNILNASLPTLFIGLAGNTTDTQWRLKAGSPAIAAGVAGADCGIYGGPMPYRPSGIQAGQPTITNFTIPGSVPANGILNVKVSAKVN